MKALLLLLLLGATEKGKVAIRYQIGGHPASYVVNTENNTVPLLVTSTRLNDALAECVSYDAHVTITGIWVTVEYTSLFLVERVE